MCLLSKYCHTDIEVFKHTYLPGTWNMTYVFCTLQVNEINSDILKLLYSGIEKWVKHWLTMISSSESAYAY